MYTLKSRFLSSKQMHLPENRQGSHSVIPICQKDREKLFDIC